MDSDISHAVEERLAAIEARLDEIDGGGAADEDETEVVSLDEETEESRY